MLRRLLSSTVEKTGESSATANAMKPVTKRQPSKADVLRYHRELDGVRRQFWRETKSVPTKHQACIAQKSEARAKNEQEWQQFMQEMRPRLQAMPHGVRSIRRCLKALDHRPPRKCKSEVSRPLRLLQKLRFELPAVVRRRVLAADWQENLLPRLITPENAKDRIAEALEEPKVMDESIDHIVRRIGQRRVQLAQRSSVIKAQIENELASTPKGLPELLQAPAVRSGTIIPRRSWQSRN